VPTTVTSYLIRDPETGDTGGPVAEQDAFGTAKSWAIELQRQVEIIDADGQVYGVASP
jgi:hypothetical protein